MSNQLEKMMVKGPYSSTSVGAALFFLFSASLGLTKFGVFPLNALKSFYQDILGKLKIFTFLLSINSSLVEWLLLDVHVTNTQTFLPTWSCVKLRKLWCLWIMFVTLLMQYVSES